MEHAPVTGPEMASSSDDDKKDPKKKKVLPRVPLPFGEQADTQARPEEPPKEAKRAEDLAAILSRAFGRGEEQKSEKAETGATKTEKPAEVAQDKLPEVAEASDESAEQSVETPDTADAEQVETDEEALTPAEATEAGTRITEAKQEEIAAERAAAEPDSPEAKVAAAAADYYDEFKVQLAKGVPVDEAAAAAVETVTGEPAPELPEAEEMADVDLNDDEAEPVAIDIDSEETDETVPLAGGAYMGGGVGGPHAGGGAAAGGFAPGFAGAAAGGNVLHTPPAHEDDDEPERRRNSGFVPGLLIGIITGEIHGRRSARKKTERRLAPVIKGLEKEVARINTLLVTREAQVRRAVRERVLAEAYPAAAPVAAESISRQPEQKLAAAPVHAERIAEKKAEAPKPAPKAVEKMTTEEVARIAEKIVVGSRTVREIYEDHLVSERGLRNIVDAHLSGKEVQRVLADELIKKEMSYEQDPQLRDLPNTVAPATQAAREAAIYEQTADAHASLVSPLQPTGMPAAAPTQTQPQTSQPAPRGLIVANMVAVAVLGVLLLVLFIIWLAR